MSSEPTLPPCPRLNRGVHAHNSKASAKKESTTPALLHVVYTASAALRRCTGMLGYAWVRPGESVEAARQALCDICVECAGVVAKATFLYLDSW